VSYDEPSGSQTDEISDGSASPDLLPNEHVGRRVSGRVRSNPQRLSPSKAVMTRRASTVARAAATAQSRKAQIASLEKELKQCKSGNLRRQLKKTLEANKRLLRRNISLQQHAHAHEHLSIHPPTYSHTNAATAQRIGICCWALFLSVWRQSVACPALAGPRMYSNSVAGVVCANAASGQIQRSTELWS
jgi:hypothetical protein